MFDEHQSNPLSLTSLIQRKLAEYLNMAHIKLKKYLMEMGFDIHALVHRANLALELLLYLRSKNTFDTPTMYEPDMIFLTLELLFI